MLRISISHIVLLVAVFFFSSVQSFGLAPRRVVRPLATSLKMAWGLQKVGQPVINTNTAVTTPVETGTIFDRKHVISTGNDERGTVDGSSVSADMKEKHYKELTALDTNFRKQALLIGLSSKWSQPESMERIGMAATVEGLLPSTFALGASSSTVVSSGSMNAGGLTSEWDFDF